MILVSMLFLITSLYMIREIEKQSGQIGVRFTQEVIDSRQLDQLYEEVEDEEWPRVTLWKQTEHVPAFYEELNREVLLKLVDIWGDVEQVYPDCLVAGAPLIKDDEAGCMLTEKAAEKLFGGTDVIGMHVMLEKKEYIIRGILDIPEEIFIRENSNTSYTFVEAEGHPRGGTEKLRQMLVSVGASLDDGAVVETDTFCGVLKVLWLLPAFLLLYCIYRNAKQMCGDRKLFVWILRILAVVIVVIILWHSWGFSEDFIPSKWSDLEFFGDLFKAQRENYNRYLDVAEVYKDRILFDCFKRALIWDGAFLIWDVVFLILPRPKLTYYDC